jgi:hypothetical protein
MKACQLIRPRRKRKLHLLDAGKICMQELEQLLNQESNQVHYSYLAAISVCPLQEQGREPRKKCYKWKQELEGVRGMREI